MHSTYGSTAAVSGLELAFCQGLGEHVFMLSSGEVRYEAQD